MDWVSEPWLKLWRWYVENCNWICPNGCSEATCCDCCIWAPYGEPRERKILEKLQELRM